MKFFREPLFHFLLLGAGLFFLSSLVNKPEGELEKQIVVTPGKVEQLITGFSRIWQRPPTQQELEGLIQDFIKEEVWYREGQTLGLDRDDTVIRRRLRQKMEFLAEDFGETADPTEEELQIYLNQHAGRFGIGAKISFTQVYLNTDRRGGETEDDAEELRLQLSADPGHIRNSEIGDPFPLPRDFTLLTQNQVANLFGKDFSAQLFKLEPDVWAGPVPSGYGLHLVLVRERVEGRAPALAEVREAIKREWLAMNRQKAKERFYEHLRNQYTVTVDYPEGLGATDKLSSTGEAQE